MEEALIPDNDFAIRLPSFEGPLDLLLYLIRRSEVDIYDIPIERVTEQYIDALSSMETPDLEAAGEFFVMASTLMYIKSRMLLPRKDQGSNEDAEDLGNKILAKLEEMKLEYFPPTEISFDSEEVVSGRRFKKVKIHNEGEKMCG